MIFDPVKKVVVLFATVNKYHNLIGSQVIVGNFDQVIPNFLKIVQDIVHRRRIERCALVFYHLFFAAHNSSQPECIPATLTPTSVATDHVPGFEANQRHAFHPKSSDHQLAYLSLGSLCSLFVEHFGKNQFRMMMPATVMFTFIKSSTHLCGCIS